MSLVRKLLGSLGSTRSDSREPQAPIFTNVPGRAPIKLRSYYEKLFLKLLRSLLVTEFLGGGV
jgi:hypothetical protein